MFNQVVKDFVDALHEWLETIENFHEVLPYPKECSKSDKKASFNHCGKTYLHLNTKGYCHRPVPCARSRC